MKKIIISFLVLASSCASQQESMWREPSGLKVMGHFNCSNAPALKWGTYYCVSASFSDSKNLNNIFFGTCEGSSKAEEEEPVDQVSIAHLKHRDSLLGASKGWERAIVFDVSTKEHGAASLLLQPEIFQHTGADRIEARLMIKVNGQQEDIRLTCGASLNE